MTSVDENKTRDETLPSVQEYVAMHQRAFRFSFDFLNAHFPPSFSAEWWEKTVADVSKTMDKDPYNELLTWLMVSVMNYLSDECKKRKNTGGHTNEN